MIQQPQTIKNQFKHLDKVIIIHQPAEKKSLPHICWNAYKPYTPPQKKKHQLHAFFWDVAAQVNVFVRSFLRGGGLQVPFPNDHWLWDGCLAMG